MNAEMQRMKKRTVVLLIIIAILGLYGGYYWLIDTYPDVFLWTKDKTGSENWASCSVFDRVCVVFGISLVSSLSLATIALLITLAVQERLLQGATRSVAGFLWGPESFVRDLLSILSYKKKLRRRKKIKQEAQSLIEIARSRLTDK